MLDGDVLVIGTGHLPPTCDQGCLPNGTRTRDVLRFCKYPGVDVLILSMLLKSVKLDGIFVNEHNSTNRGAVLPLLIESVASGSADISGITFGQKYLAKENSSTLELSSTPVIVDGGLFLTLSTAAPMVKMSSEIFDIFSPDLWCVIGLTLVLIVALSWYLSHVKGMSNASVVNLGCWLFVILSGVFTNILAVKLAAPKVSRSQYKDLPDLMAKIATGECAWYAPDELYEAFFTGTVMTSRSEQLKKLVELEKRMPMQLINAGTGSHDSLNMEWVGLDYILKRQAEKPGICHVLFTSQILGTYFLKLASLRGASVEMLPLNETRDLFGYVFRKDLPARVKEKLVQMTSDRSLPQLYSNIVEEMAKDAMIRISKRSGTSAHPVYFQRKVNYHRLELWQLADFFRIMSYSMCASVLVFAVYDSGRCWIGVKWK